MKGKKGRKKKLKRKEKQGAGSKRQPTQESKASQRQKSYLDEEELVIFSH